MNFKSRAQKLVLPGDDRQPAKPNRDLIDLQARISQVQDQLSTIPESSDFVYLNVSEYQKSEELTREYDAQCRDQIKTITYRIF